jgi:hypothetical protein
MFLPEIIRRISDDNIRTVLIAGFGGGFDFVHGAILLPELHRLNKKIIFGSYSFGDPQDLQGQDAEIVFQSDETNLGEDQGVCVKRVTGRSTARHAEYAPEIHMCSFLDSEYPKNAPHWMYAYYARAFTVPLLRRFYEHVVHTHAVDCVLLIDGGSDSLMAGDEAGLGDPLEDTVSVAAVATLTNPRIRLKALLCLGLGTDRFNNVSDAASLRAISELTAEDGFLGCMSLLKDSEPMRVYKACVAHISSRQEFRSVLTGCIIAAAEGAFGADVPRELADNHRVKPGETYIWPLMSVVWAFHAEAVYQRSMIARWIEEEKTKEGMHKAFLREQRLVQARPVENLPRHEDFSYACRLERLWAGD